MRVLSGIFCSLFLACTVFAQSSLTLSVDATEAPRKILHTRETISVNPGPLTLMYAEWIPGEHMPSGPVIDVAGLHIRADGKDIPWRRDLVDMFAIHTTIPQGSKEIEVTFDFLLPVQSSGYSAGASSSSNLLILSWNQVLMYPSSPAPDHIMIHPSLRLPEGWKYGTALTTDRTDGATIHFAAATLNSLIDSPVQAGEHFKRVDITPAGGPPHHLDMVSDDESALAITPEQTEHYKRLVAEELSLFGAHHFDHYDFLFTLSDDVAHFGLEHHQSSDDRVDERTLVDNNLFRAHAALLSHEFTHSWNGKFRRPQGLNVANFTRPMQDDLLWVYEGLTEYLGAIISPRSGVRSKQDYLDNMALIAARLDNEAGRTWRPLQDCADEAVLLYSSRGDWSSWRRGVDFYDEGNLIWLDADVTIRQLSNGTKTLDDFCKKFHGAPSTPAETKPYTFDDVVTTLNSIVKYDWRKFLNDRLQSLSPHAPLGGIEHGGWKLVYTDKENDFESALEEAFGFTDLNYSLGFSLGKTGNINDVAPGSPAAKAGIAPGMRLTAVNGMKYNKLRMDEALETAKSSSAPIQLLVTNGDAYKTYSVDYHAGARYPHLERNSSQPDILSAIIQPTAK